MSYKNSNKIIAGLDMSLTSTGITIMDSSAKILHQESLSTKKMRGMDRIKFIRGRILQKLKQYQVTTISIEHYAYGSQGQSTIDLGELGGIIRMALLDNGYEYTEISPKSLKGYTSFNGASNKPMMREAIFKKYGIDYGKEDDIADSYALCMMTLELGDKIQDIISEGGVDRYRFEFAMNARSKLFADPSMFLSIVHSKEVKYVDFESIVNLPEAKDKCGLLPQDFDMLKNNKKYLPEIIKKYAYVETVENKEYRDLSQPRKTGVF